MKPHTKNLTWLAAAVVFASVVFILAGMIP